MGTMGFLALIAYMCINLSLGVDKRIHNFEEGMNYYILVFYKERGVGSAIFFLPKY